MELFASGLLGSVIVGVAFWLRHQQEWLAAQSAWRDSTSATLGNLAKLEERVAELEKLWAVARENPELVRELAVEALKGGEPGG